MEQQRIPEQTSCQIQEKCSPDVGTHLPSWQYALQRLFHYRTLFAAVVVCGSARSIIESTLLYTTKNRLWASVLLLPGQLHLISNLIKLLVSSLCGWWRTRFPEDHAKDVVVLRTDNTNQIHPMSCGWLLANTIPMGVGLFYTINNLLLGPPSQGMHPAIYPFCANVCKFSMTTLFMLKRDNLRNFATWFIGFTSMLTLLIMMRSSNSETAMENVKWMAYIIVANLFSLGAMHIADLVQGKHNSSDPLTILQNNWHVFFWEAFFTMAVIITTRFNLIDMATQAVISYTPSVILHEGNVFELDRIQVAQLHDPNGLVSFENPGNLPAIFDFGVFGQSSVNVSFAVSIASFKYGISMVMPVCPVPLDSLPTTLAQVVITLLNIIMVFSTAAYGLLSPIFSRRTSSAQFLIRPLTYVAISALCFLYPKLLDKVLQF